MTGNAPIVKWIGWALVCLFAIISSGIAMGQSQQTRQAQNPVSASVEPAQVTVGDSILYQVTIHVTGSGQPSVAVPVMDPDSGLSTPRPSGTQSSLETYINGGQFRTVQKIVYGYTIRTSKEGTFTIPPATVTLNGKMYDTEPVQVEVKAMPEAKNIPSELEGLVVAPQVQGNPELQRRLTGVVFILPVLSTTEPYNGEQVRISYHLVIDPRGLADADLSPHTNLDNIHIPQMSDFIAEELYPFPQDLKFQEREIGGQLYLVAPVYEAVLASTKSGELKIEPFQISMLFSMKNQGGRRRSPFPDDPFFSSISPFTMMGGNSVQVIAQSPVLTLNVKPVPSVGRPADFAGAVGDFTITSEVDSKKARAYDDTVKLNVTIEGEGNTQSLSPPDLPDMPAFTVLGDPEEQVSGRKEGDRYISTKKFTYTLRPTASGSQTIPEIAMSTFDPDSEDFERVKSEPIAMMIAPGSRPAPAPAPTDAQEDIPDEPAPEADLRYISTQVLSAPGYGLTSFRGPAGYALFLLPLALLAGGLAVAWQQKHGGQRRVDPRKEASASSSQHLKEAHRALTHGEMQKMYADVSEGMRLFFAARFAVPAAEVTIMEIENRLNRKGVPSEVIDRITGVLETCDSARYAPISPSRDDAANSLRQAEKLLKEVEAFV